jgi:hypothetical protein
MVPTARESARPSEAASGDNRPGSLAWPGWLALSLTAWSIRISRQAQPPTGDRRVR